MAALLSQTGRATVKSGMCQLTAVACERGKTRLSRVSHAAPMRLIPVGSSSVSRAGAALVALSSYGGGMLQGDENRMDVDVKEGATLGVVTQGSNRIYKCNRRLTRNSNVYSSSLHPSGEHDTTCRSNINVKVSNKGFLVLAPDPCVAFSASSFVQDQHIHVEHGASAIVVDWFGAGRVCNGERWDFTRLASKTSLYKNQQDNITNNEMPFLVESVMMDRRFSSSADDPFGFDAGQEEFNAFCSIILHGPQVQAVADRCKVLERELVAKHTSTRNRHDFPSTSNSGSLDLVTLSGRVLMGVSKVSSSTGDNHELTYVARLAATSNEDIYRVLHSCLSPLRETFGFDFYRDRLRASATAAVPAVSQQERIKGQASHAAVNGQATNSTVTGTASSSTQQPSGHAAWCAYMLADSGLPTGGFAHSAGIEAASQLGLFGGTKREERVSAYIYAATRSATQLLTPFVAAGHNVVAYGKTEILAVEAHEQWLDLDGYAHAVMSSNAPACRASLDQGQGLLRVTKSWLGNNSTPQTHQMFQGEREKAVLELLTLVQGSVSDTTERGHIGPIFGMVGGLLGLTPQETCRVLGFCAARDMVSAAVRLNLVGPLASVGILNNAWSAVNDGYDVAASQIRTEEKDLEGIMTAAACSPVADAIHPCQDLLSVRLFRT